MEEKISKKKKKKDNLYVGIGRRKEATARVRMETGVKRDEVGIWVNDRKVEDYFPGESYKLIYLAPLKAVNSVDRFKITIKVEGGGLSGQVGACVHGISRALLVVDEEKYRPVLKKRGFLKRDPRVKERRKAGLAGKARKKRQSPKR